MYLYKYRVLNKLFYFGHFAHPFHQCLNVPGHIDVLLLTLVPNEKENAENEWTKCVKLAISQQNCD